MPKRAWRKTTVPASFCPYCLYRFDRAGLYRFDRAGVPAGRTRPKPGDFSVCIECANILEFDAELRMVKPAPGALERAFQSQPELEQEMRQTQRAVTLANASGQAPGKPAH